MLEHIPDIQPVLNEVGRVLQPDAPFVITTPSQFFADYLGGGAAGSAASGWAGRALSGLFQLHLAPRPHRLAPDVGRTAGRGRVRRRTVAILLLARRIARPGDGPRAGLAVGRAPRPDRPLDSSPPGQSSLGPTERWLRPFYEEAASLDGGAYLLLIARKVADRPIAATLPPPRPLSVAEPRPA